MTVYYLCNWDSLSGGIRVLYDHVRTLRRSGVDARLGATGTFLRCVWFDHKIAEIPGVDDVLDKLRPGDRLVVPELLLADPSLRHSPAGLSAFVQNLKLVPPDVDWSRFELVLTASTPLFDALRPAIADRVSVVAVPHFLATDLVAPPRTWFAAARPKALINPRFGKHRNEPYLTARMLEDSGLDVTVAERPMHRNDFVRLFRDHALYLHLSYPEGFPGPVAEAFGAGCLVAGFTGLGGLEFMRDGENCLTAEDGDWRQVVRHARSVLRRPAAELSAMIASARATILRYDEATFARRLTAAFAAERRRR